ncbi:MAG: PIN domain-containing protein [Rhodocyclaceae bacterium]|nr:PIN domain-containing protein [Rhodocyclaceae bacterium]
MRHGVLLDTGPLVAYFCPTDRFHDWAVSQFAAFAPPVTTCEPVLAESCFLLARAGVPATRILAKVTQGALRIGLNVEREAAAIATLMQRYADRPMSLADACLVRMAEILPGSLCTLDGDFHVYRRHGRTPLDLIVPDRV